ncbi:jasmonoyl--L-amino acid synthetase JAR6-like [Pollicipes pollicipes]|uniref:jasmonoyl--L-amino acid synthetase JAR6-like n=1 Tax=Pollicipes pollicipes TaxID=41117 RepID=UPI0018853912|nr:jasmonoyl--L-amino acid synthetase JAR6-like [Pollicipes pollicipes]
MEQSQGVVALLLLVTIDLVSMPRSRFHTWRSMLLQYLMRRVSQLVGAYGWWRLGAGYCDLYRAQERFVLETLRQNEDSDYGRHHRFSEIHSLEEFRRAHPVTEYDHFKPYIQRVMDGDLRALYGPKENISMFYCSSGTTGSSKHIPMTSNGFNKTMANIFGAIHGFVGKDFFPSDLMKVMQLPCAPRWRYTKTGVKIGPASVHAMSSVLVASQYSMPREANIIASEAEALHVGFVLALRDRGISSWEAGFAFGLWNQLQFLERHWPLLVQDIRTGRLNATLKVSDEQRRTIDALLTPEPRRADELQREFELGFDGIVPRIFPRMRMVSALSSGTSMAVYRERCKRYLGGLPVCSIIYTASEGVLGVNVREPGRSPAYALVPGGNFVEFLPVNESGEAEPGVAPLLASEVRVGQLYEVVVTNATGLYRYRMGDVVRVVGTFHQSPTFDFQFRAKQMLNVHMEKVSEAAFTAALQQAVDAWPDQRLLDFTTAESVLDSAGAAGPPHYLVFLELNGPPLSPEQAADVDRSLQESHYVYKSFRVKDAIGPMRLVRVHEGTFTAFRQHVCDTTPAAMQQFKQPRVLRTEEQVRFFLERAV